MNFINEKFKEYDKERKEKYQEIKKLKKNISEISHDMRKHLEKKTRCAGAVLPTKLPVNPQFKRRCKREY